MTKTPQQLREEVARGEEVYFKHSTSHADYFWKVIGLNELGNIHPVCVVTYKQRDVAILTENYTEVGLENVCKEYSDSTPEEFTAALERAKEVIGI